MHHWALLGVVGVAASLVFADLAGCSSTNSGSGDGGASCVAPTSTAGAGGNSGGTGGAPFGGMGGSGAGESCGEETSVATSELLPVDIIIAVDTSSSMAEGFPAGIGPSEIAEVNANLNAAAAIITAASIDVHIIMIASSAVCIGPPVGAGNCGNDELLPAYRHVPHYVASAQVYRSILDTYDQWQDSLRPNAIKRILVVTDDDDDMAAYGAPAAFLEQLVALNPGFAEVRVDSIVAFEGPEICTSGCGNDPCCPCWPTSPITWPLSAADGEAYRTLSAWTGGVEGNLCLQDFDPFFQHIGEAVVEDTPISCIYDIPAPPEGETLDRNRVNVQFSPEVGALELIPRVQGADSCGISGWYYDNPDDPSEIILCPATCAAVRSLPGEIRVQFGCETKFV